MKWNVFYHSSNNQKIETFNIFDHSGFCKDVECLIKKHHDKKEFSNMLRSSLMYFFWSKAEYEIIISPWCGDNTQSVKVDVYDQVLSNWDIFLNYVWSNRKHDVV